MYNKYIDIFSNCSKSVLKNMCDIDVSDVTIKQEKFLSTNFSIAHSVHYEDIKNKINGDFILGFIDDSEAIPVAAAIAKNFGLSPIEKYDDTASDVINEFLNTVVGHAITELYKKGVYMTFTPPVVSQNKNINFSVINNTIAYLISLGFDPGTINSVNTEGLSLIVTFTITNGQELLGKRILVADDSKLVRKLIAEALKKAGFEIDQASDGQEAVEKHKIFKPDLTIIDLVMPKMNGLDAIIEIQDSDPEAKFMVFSSISRRDEVVSAKSLNVLSYLVKPLKMEDLLIKVQEAFEQIKNEE